MSKKDTSSFFELLTMDPLTALFENYRDPNLFGTWYNPMLQGPESHAVVVFDSQTIIINCDGFDLTKVRVHLYGQDQFLIGDEWTIPQMIREGIRPLDLSREEFVRINGKTVPNWIQMNTVAEAQQSIFVMLSNNQLKFSVQEVLDEILKLAEDIVSELEGQRKAKKTAIIENRVLQRQLLTFLESASPAIEFPKNLSTKVDSAFLDFTMNLLYPKTDLLQVRGSLFILIQDIWPELYPELDKLFRS